jgi:hypothetical protein
MWLGLNAILEHVTVGRSHQVSHGIEELLNHAFGDEQTMPLTIVQVGAKAPWGMTFEDIRQRLDDDGRAYLEGDGSFVLCGNQTCHENNRQTCWLGRLPKLAQVVSTTQWRSNSAEFPHPTIVWRIEGNLCDGAMGLDSISLNGWAPWPEWQKLFQLIGPRRLGSGPDGVYPVLQLHHFGVYVELPAAPTE